MKICIYGTGAVGASIGSMLANAGHEMTFIARGKHLIRMQEWGLTMITPNGVQTITGHFTNLMTTVETPDYLFICVKAFSIPEIEENVNRITGPDTVIIPVINGIPWWHFLGWEGKLKGFVPLSLDPKGNLAKFFPYPNLVGGLAYTAGAIKETGVVENLKYPPRLMIGEIDDKISPRIEKLGATLEQAGFASPIVKNIRAEIWLKLCWNIAFNPISALTGMNALQITENLETREAAVKLMRELEMVALALEIPLKLDIEERMNVARKSGQHKPSMLQDVENGRRMEIDAIVGVIAEIADKLSIECPNIDKLLSALRAKESSLR